MGFLGTTSKKSAPIHTHHTCTIRGQKKQRKILVSFCFMWNGLFIYEEKKSVLKRHLDGITGKTKNSGRIKIKIKLIQNERYGRHAREKTTHTNGRSHITRQYPFECQADKNISNMLSIEQQQNAQHSIK